MAELIKNIDNIPVRNIFLNLIGLEYAFANNKTLTLTTIVEQYDTKLLINRTFLMIQLILLLIFL